jgi:hypothetical protein
VGCLPNGKNLAGHYCCQLAAQKTFSNHLLADDNWQLKAWSKYATSARTCQMVKVVCDGKGIFSGPAY